MKKSISDDLLSQVNGGYVVGVDGQYYVVADKTGSVLSKGPVMSLAQMAAQYEGQSPQVISTEEYKSIFGKEFQA